MKKILVLYFSQTGQLRSILDKIVSQLHDRTEISYAEIKMQKPFPFPWSVPAFFDAMPEAHLMIPADIEPMPALLNQKYDLVIYGYAPWFLNQSIPSNSFLQSEYAAIMKDTPVVTIIGSRNMWLNAQENVKQQLQKLGAQLVGNIVFEDKTSNIKSVLTILRWMLKGQKEATKRLPEAGVSGQDIQDARRFGPVILENLIQGTLPLLQSDLLAMGAVMLQPQLVILEKRGLSQFPKWAKRARAEGLPGDEARQPILQKFKKLLFVGIFFLSPLSAASAGVIVRLKAKKMKDQVDYLKSVAFRKGGF